MKPRADSPVDPLALLVIREIYKASSALGFPVFMVGAMARIILLDNIFGLNAGRATKDVDFAFALDNWDQFETLKAFLISNANFEESAHIAHRMLFRIEGAGHKYNVDLIPFGRIASSTDTITWPPKMDVIMNVAGYGDALAAAVHVEIEAGIVMAIASLPGMAIMKFFAWADRRQETTKDAHDLVLLLRCYHEAANETRIYEDALAVAALESVGYDVELAGAWLLGHDALVMSSAQTQGKMKEVLAGTKYRRLAEDMSGAMRNREDALAYSKRLLEQFNKGFAACASIP
jgi:predicted nucleotidyltransferase